MAKDAGFKRAKRRITAALRERATELDLSHMGLTALPAEIGQLVNLQTLRLDGNKLTALPAEIGQLVNLQELNLNNNQLIIRTLPAEIGQLVNLQTLNLDGNKLAALPAEIGQLVNLHTLSLQHNQLTTLPAEIGQLVNLKTLGVNDNQLTALPAEIGQLVNLQTLELFQNRLTALPAEIGQLVNLRKLNVGQNRLTALPSGIGRLVNLQRLYLTANQLTNLPAEVSQLVELKLLTLRMNRLATLPDSLRKLERLRVLTLHGNIELKIPAEVLGTASAVPSDAADPRAILDYYFRTREGARPLNEAKLILVGRGGVGKTTLITRLTTGKFSSPKKTEGIIIKEWQVPLSRKEKVQLNVWDFGGQEIMHSTHQFFLTERSLYLLVLSGREGHEDEDAEYWLKLIQSFGGDSPVIVVLNKQGEHPFDVNRGGLLQKYPNIKNFVATDCKNGLGIGELRKAIKRETDRLEGLRAQFPAQWFKIKDRLAGMKENYLTFEKYREICGKLGEKESEAQGTLAGHLHTLGIALNYCDDPRLSHMHVLNPHWVVEGIYLIINAPTLAKGAGELRDRDLRNILPKKNYPPAMHGYLVDLMKKFELCFSLPEDGRFLVPDLLPKEQADAAKGFKEDECLHFRYDYGATPVPEGLLPRFIVRTHALSRNLPRWRTGVVLEFEGNRALVRADKADKKVFIWIDGPAAGRRRLLAIIRSDFDHIHSDIKKLEPTELVPVPGHPDVTVKHEDLLAFENSGVPNVQVNVGGRIESMPVGKLLSSVDVKRAKGSAVPVFISYTHKDERFREDLEAHLKLLQRQGLIEMWHDRRIGPGREWPEEIDKNLERAGIILLLISADFINSNFCWDKERTKAMELRRRGRADVIPVVVRSVNWKSSDLSKLQALPKDAKPVDEWDKPDAAWSSVAAKIEEMARKRLRAKGAGAR